MLAKVRSHEPTAALVTGDGTRAAEGYGPRQRDGAKARKYHWRI